jgi:archaellum component FlaC
MDNYADPDRDPDMEARMSRLEAQFGRIEALLGSLDDRYRSLDNRIGSLDDRVGRLDDRVRNVEVGLAELKGRVSQLPSTWAMITAVIGGQIATIGMVAALFKLVFPH